MRITSAILAVSFAIHLGLGWLLHERKPHLGILPPVPNSQTVRALAFGDTQLLYRYWVLEIQNAGDTGGRFTPMAQYDVGGVVEWLKILQLLDSRSNHYPALAVRYFSHIDNGDALRRLIDFVANDIDCAPARKWYWQTQLVALARGTLKDLDLALTLSRKLTAFVSYLPEGFAWVVQIEPILLEDLGRYAEASNAMQRNLQLYPHSLTPGEAHWTRDFLDRVAREQAPTSN